MLLKEGKTILFSLKSSKWLYHWVQNLELPFVKMSSISYRKALLISFAESLWSSFDKSQILCGILFEAPHLDSVRVYLKTQKWNHLWESKNLSNFPKIFGMPLSIYNVYLLQYHLFFLNLVGFPIDPPKDKTEDFVQSPNPEDLRK